MKGIKLTNDGDIDIVNNRISTIDGSELLRQTVQAVLSTHEGEWFLNDKEGINYNLFITKKPDFEVIRSAIIEGLQQVDSTFQLEKYNYLYDKNRRTLTINFTAKNSKGEYVSGNQIY